jgi:hypothetical protein
MSQAKTMAARKPTIAGRNTGKAVALVRQKAVALVGLCHNQCAPLHRPSRQSWIPWLNVEDDTVKLQILIAPIVAAAALASGCASWDTQDHGDDYQCGYAGSTKGHDSTFASRHGWSGCSADYAAAVVYEIITKGTP